MTYACVEKSLSLKSCYDFTSRLSEGRLLRAVTYRNALLTTYNYTYATGATNIGRIAIPET